MPVSHINSFLALLSEEQIGVIFEQLVKACTDEFEALRNLDEEDVTRVAYLFSEILKNHFK